MDWNDDLQFSDDLFGSTFSSGSCDAMDLWTLVDTDVESDLSDVVQPEQQVRFEASILFFSISIGLKKISFCAFRAMRETAPRHSA